MIVAVPVLRPRKGWKSARQLQVATAYAKTQSLNFRNWLLISVKASSVAIVAQRSWVACVRCSATAEHAATSPQPLNACCPLPATKTEPSESVKGLKLCVLSLAKCLKPAVRPSVFGRLLCTFCCDCQCRYLR